MVKEAYKDAKSKQKTALTEEQIQINKEEAKLKAGIEEAIATGTITGTQIAKYSDVLDEDTINGLLEKRNEAENKRAEERAKIDTIGQKFKAGMKSEITTEDANKYYEHLISEFEMDSGEPLDLEDKARVAASLDTPIKSLSTSLSSKIGIDENISGTQAQEAINAYTYLTDRGSNALSDNKNFGEDEVAFYEYASTLVEDAGMPADQAFKAAHNALNTDDTVKKSLRTKFAKVEAFSAANIEETMNDALEIEGFFGGNQEIDPSTANLFRTIAQDTYMKTGGSVVAAKKAAASYLKKTHAVSNLGGKSTYMFAAPEKVFKDMGLNLSSDAIQSMVDKDVKKYLPAGAENVRLIEYEINGDIYILNNPMTDNALRWGK